MAKDFLRKFFKKMSIMVIYRFDHLRPEVMVHGRNQNIRGRLALVVGRFYSLLFTDRVFCRYGLLPRFQSVTF